MDTTAETDETASQRSALEPDKSIPQPAIEKPLIYRQFAWTRITHWIWAISLFFLLLTGLQIFNAHPTLYIGDQSGFQFDNDVLAIGAENTEAGPRGYHQTARRKVRHHRRARHVRPGRTAALCGLSGLGDDPVASRPRHRPRHPFLLRLAAGRTLLAWLVASLVNGHFRELVPTLADLRQLPRDIADHARLKFHHTRDYNTLQKLTYAIVLFIFFPLMILTGLAMSPGANALLPFLPDLLGGRQTARTIHFIVMALLVAFFVVHIVMILAAGPINELRSIITGWYRTDPPADERPLPPNEECLIMTEVQDQPPRLHHLRRARRLGADAFRLRCLRQSEQSRQWLAQFLRRRQRPHLSRAAAARRRLYAGAGIHRGRHPPAAAAERRHRARRRLLQGPAVRRFRRLAAEGHRASSRSRCR